MSTSNDVSVDCTSVTASDFPSSTRCGLLGPTLRRGVLRIPILFCLLLASAPLAGDELPATSDRSPVPVPHFPDTAHAVVWRNWGLVEPDCLAEVLGTDSQQVRDMAVSMGLPRNVVVPSEMRERGYITLIRRNWHLLPYEQLLQILKISSSELAFRLREHDFLFEHLGSIKPKCPPVKYQPLSPDQQTRLAAIRELVQREFGEELQRPVDPLFNFITAYRTAPAESTSPRNSRPSRGPRFIYSYFAMFGDPLINPDLDPFPDGLLAKLREQGVNGIWLHTVLRQLAPGGRHFPEFGEGSAQRLKNLNHLVQRAKRFGIDIYLYMNEPRAMPEAFFASRPEMAGVTEHGFRAMCTSDPRVLEWVRDALTNVFTQVPNLGGVFTITASENLTHCASHGTHKKNCPRCSKRDDVEIQLELISAIETGVHRAAPAAKVIVWDWGWQFNPQLKEPELIRRLPQSTALMSVSEWSLPINRGGVKSLVGEYSLSAVGPGPRAQLHWKVAKEHGLKTIAKVQLNNTWELSSLPALPVLDLVAEHCDRLEQLDVDGMMMSWSLGGSPSINLELASEFTARPVPTREAALNMVAARHYGTAATPGIRRAWSHFSQAFREYPYHQIVIYVGPMQVGAANLLHLEPTKYSASVIGFPFDDLTQWRGPYPPEVFISQFRKVANGWRVGLEDFDKALPLVPQEKQAEAVADLRIAQAAEIYFSSAANQAEFIMTRDAWRAARTAEERLRLKHSLQELLTAEQQLAKRMFTLAAADSRIGFEASNHYNFVPLDLIEKFLSCHQIAESLSK